MLFQCLASMTFFQTEGSSIQRRHEAQPTLKTQLPPEQIHDLPLHCRRTSVIYITTSEESAHFCQTHLYQCREACKCGAASTTCGHVYDKERISYPLPPPTQKNLQHLGNKLFMQNRQHVHCNQWVTYMHTTPIGIVLFTLLLVFILYLLFFLSFSSTLLKIPLKTLTQLRSKPAVSTLHRPRPVKGSAEVDSDLNVDLVPQIRCAFNFTCIITLPAESHKQASDSHKYLCLHSELPPCYLCPEAVSAVNGCVFS